MLIDWFTVGAQALNFIILVWLLRRFLYRPILDAIDEREQRIARELAAAAGEKAAAQREREELRNKNAEFDRQRAELLNAATRAAQVESQRLLDAARQAADVLTAKRQETLRSDAHQLNQAISRRAQQEVFAIARQALTDLAGANLEQCMSEVFTQRLRVLNGAAKSNLAKELQAATQPAIVRSAFELPAAQQSAIQNAVNEAFSLDVPLRYETAPDLVSGIEFATNEHKISWSIADYLASLETGVAELLRDKDAAAAKPLAGSETKAAAAQPATAPETSSP